MESLNLTTLRKNLYRVVDRVLESGMPVEIERKGKKVLLIPSERIRSKLSRLKKRKTIVGDPDSLWKIKVGRWKEKDNL